VAHGVRVRRRLRDAVRGVRSHRGTPVLRSTGTQRRVAWQDLEPEPFYDNVPAWEPEPDDDDDADAEPPRPDM
jgi:hypothetical protein